MLGVGKEGNFLEILKQRKKIFENLKEEIERVEEKWAVEEAV